MRKEACFLLLFCLSALMTPAALADSITVNAAPASAVGETNHSIFGQNLSYYTNAGNLWDPSTRTVDTSAKDALMADETHFGAGIGDCALVRFPGVPDTYHWRRGVGHFDANPAYNKRPKTQRTAADTDNNAVGTDEMMAVIRDLYGSERKPLIQVNWWGFNDPVKVLAVPTLPAQGAQEAANWVEYCSGSVSQTVERECLVDQQVESRTVLEWAIHEDWQPTQFVDSFGDPSLDATAHEAVAATGRSWLSTEEAPAGYFAWLRRYFAWQRAGSETYGDPAQPKWKSLTEFTESSYGAPYGVTYWEIGNEEFVHQGDGTGGTITPADYANGVIAYSKKMKCKDSTIKVGGSLDNRSVYTDGVSTWDETVIEWAGTFDETFSIYPLDFGSSHLYAFVDTDNRYARYIYGSRYPDEQDWVEPVYLEAGDYRFRFRVRGTPINDGEAMSDYPIMAAWLVTCDGNGQPQRPMFTGNVVIRDGCNGFWMDADINPPIVMEAAPKITPDARRDSQYIGTLDGIGQNRYMVRWPINGGGAVQRYTPFNYDYTFDVEVATAGYYIPWLTMPNNPNAGNCPSECCDNGRRMEQYLMSCVPLDSQGEPVGSEQLVENCDASEQTRAILATPTLVGRHIEDLKALIAHAKSVHDANPDMELGVTEFGHAIGGTGVFAQIRNLKGAVASACIVQEMLRHEVDFGCFWNLNNWFYHMAQPTCSAAYDPIENPSPSCTPESFIMSPAAQVYRLFLQHTGTELLDDPGVTTGTFTTPTPMYDSIPTGESAPYLSALATATDTDSGNGYYEKIYVTVVNKDWAADRECTITLDNLGAAPTGVTWHTLKSWDATVADPLAAQNDGGYPGRISTVSVSGVAPEYDPQTDYDITHVFPSGSITVMELTVGKPAPVYSTADLIKMPDDSSVSLDGKIVTAVFGDEEVFYIEEPDRTAGIAVAWDETETMPTVGQKVSLEGTLGTSDGERVLTPGSQPTYSGNSPLAPLGMRNQWLAGSPAGSSTPVPITGFGLYNVGLLVQSWGRVTGVDTANGDWFYIDDGSGVYDLSGLGTGIRVLWPSGVNVYADDYVRVTGISGATETANGAIPLLKPRSDGVEVVSSWTNENVPLTAGCWNLLSLAGIPSLPGPEDVFVGNTAISLSGCLYRYDAPSQTWVTYQDCGGSVFGGCLVGEGYGLYIPSGGATSYNHPRLPLGGDQWISLPYGSDPPGDMSLIGNPFTSDVKWSECKVTDGVTLLSLPEAVMAGWIHAIGTRTGSAWEAVDDLSTGEMAASTAYKVYPARNDLALIIPVPPAQ